MGVIIGGSTLLGKMGLSDQEMAKRAPKARKVEIRSKPLRAGLVYDGSPNPDPHQLPNPQLYDYNNIKGLLDVESLFARACWKYVEQIWGKGWEFISKNKPSADYVRIRFRQLAYVSGISTLELFHDIAAQLVIYSNVYVKKIRKRQSSGGQLRYEGTKRLEPIAAYVVLDTPTVFVVRDKYGVPLRYEQNLVAKSGQSVTRQIESIPPEDMIHLTFRRQVGYGEGTPMVIPIIDDIAALRRMEETAEIIAFQASIPIFHFKAGHTDDATGHANETEVTLLESQVSSMLAHGALVTNERCTVDIQQATGDIATILEFIDYYRQRVLTGFGISGVLLGEASTSNRNTSDVVSQEMQQTTKMLQDFITDAITNYMVNELLLEGSIDVFDDYYTVSVYVPAIDGATKRAEQVHALALYEGNLINEDEARILIGRDPLTDEEYMRTFLERVTIPKLEAQVDAQARATGIASEAKQRLTKSKVLPTNQYGTKAKPSKTARRDSILAAITKSLKGTNSYKSWYTTIRHSIPSITDSEMDKLLPLLQTGSKLVENSVIPDVKEMIYDDVIQAVKSYIPEEKEEV
jgi:hypothetical protein